MNKHVVGQDGTNFMVLEDNDGIYRVIAHCPSKGSAEYIVEALLTAFNRQDERISYNGR